jgi:hypothetical protein
MPERLLPLRTGDFYVELNAVMPQPFGLLLRSLCWVAQDE